MMIADCTAVILAGGESRRMGRDKATLVLGEHSLLQRVATVMNGLFPQLVVSVRERRPTLRWPQVCDAHANAGPLAGISAGLAHAETPWVFVIATDMPFVRPALIARLAAYREGFDAVVPVTHGHAQPLAAFYAKACLAPMQAALVTVGQHGPRAVLEQLNVRYVEESELVASDPELRSFFDLDTPQDVEAVQREWL